MTQPPPQRIDAPNVGSSKPATIIFMHGYSDDADGWTNIAHQFHSANKLPHLAWTFPTAPFNHEAMTTAWYTPTEFSPIPVGRSSSSTSPSNPGVAEDDETFAEESQAEILVSIEYVCGLIDREVERGVEPERIVVGGFSQGCAIALLTGLAGRSRWSGKIGGVVGLSGYLPRGKEIWGEGVKTDLTKNGTMALFLAHGTRDMLVPIRVFRDAKARVEGMVGSDRVEVHLYEGLGHVTSGEELRDMGAFLERVVPG